MRALQVPDAEIADVLHRSRHQAGLKDQRGVSVPRAVAAAALAGLRMARFGFGPCARSRRCRGLPEIPDAAASVARSRRRTGYRRRPPGTRPPHRGDDAAGDQQQQSLEHVANDRAAIFTSRVISDYVTRLGFDDDGTHIRAEKRRGRATDLRTTPCDPAERDRRPPVRS